eukprot:TRINITY_DN7708_c0_g1_i1.p1 TRINITY_DN7708_c0_g1~~TRINITY_DN7708_c0_g1_i1.p1  ORF type:complete len:347 (+),score=102.90 TRINITY_DN7708_c0_g1_i1:50-1042(+)
MALSGSTAAEKLEDLATRTYKEQAIWYLNAYWGDLESDAEKLWDFRNKFSELDLDQKDQGCSLDEMQAHRFLEAFDMTLTVRKMREGLRDTGAIGDRVKKIALCHYMLVHFKGDYTYLATAPQGDNKEEIEEAQRLLDAVQVALADSQAKASEAAQAVIEAKSRETAAQAREAEAVAAQREQEAALADLQAQEKAYNDKTTDLTTRSEQGGVVTRNKAKNELAQHLAEDPLPLRTAKITNEAAVRKAEKATKAAADARVAAESARLASEDAKAAAEAAVEVAVQKVGEAEAFLQEVKSKPGCGQGAVWWMERELHEAKKFLPLSKGGIAR